MPHREAHDNSAAHGALTIRPERANWVRLVTGLLIIGLLAIGYWFFSSSGKLEILLDANALREHIAQLGALGPLAVIGAMAIAIVINPIPSAPIALAAGAAYGHTWGTAYVLLGSEIGALIAFGIARLLGCDLLPGVCKARQSLNLLGSQNTLMVIVFVSRLLPFVSFDLVSYAAGLTALATWRFALATLAGILPASFVLAHFGAEMATSDMGRIMMTVAVLGLLMLIPIAVQRLLSKRKRIAGEDQR
ncbi:MAG: TVP38/TMEM64 family protein [Acidiferrobacterales bacterium]